MPSAMTTAISSIDGSASEVADEAGYGVLPLPFSLNPADLDPSIQLIAEIGAVHRQWQAVMDYKLRDHDLTHVRWIILWRIAESPVALNQTDLARRVGVEGSTLVRQLDALEERGLIERVADKDRRVRRIRLTAAALPVLILVRDMATRLGREILADVDPEQVARSATVLHAVREHLRDRESATTEVVSGE